MAHKLRIELEYTDPKVYRTVIVPEHFSFHHLHIVIQCVMNWEDYHLYQFYVGSPYMSDSIKLPDAEENDFAGFWESEYLKYDSTETFLADFFNGQKKKMSYLYDFGDSWQHIIKPLKKSDEVVLFPKCIKGENAAPVEDCGGIPGFYELLEVLNKKRNTKEKMEIIQWLELPKGKSYEDVFGFHIDRINQKLLEMFS